MSVIQTIVNAVKTGEHYVPRGYETIGGMWTIDMWRKDDVVVRLLDEGYTTIITAPGLRVVDSGNGTVFEQGTAEDLEKLAASIQ
jgi:hypothetical protein